MKIRKHFKARWQPLLCALPQWVQDDTANSGTLWFRQLRHSSMTHCFPRPLGTSLFWLNPLKVTFVQVCKKHKNEHFRCDLVWNVLFFLLKCTHKCMKAIQSKPVQTKRWVWSTISLILKWWATIKDTMLFKPGCNLCLCNLCNVCFLALSSGWHSNSGALWYRQLSHSTMTHCFPRPLAPSLLVVLWLWK